MSTKPFVLPNTPLHIAYVPTQRYELTRNARTVVSGQESRMNSDLEVFSPHQPLDLGLTASKCHGQGTQIWFGCDFGQICRECKQK